MKQIGLVFVVSMLATVGFSQQTATSERKVTFVNQSKEEVLPIAADSTAVLYSSSREMKSEVVPVPKENESNKEKKPEKTTVSSAKKPD